MTFLIGFGAGVGACLVLLLLALRGQTAALRSQHDEIAALLDADPGSWQQPRAPIDTKRASGPDGTEDPAGPEEGEEA
uniref:hypothetical protein n=1 Tax=Stappia sp. TaxID=1870903 RepID=UPI003BAD898C